jgi:hypothetical protein
MKVDISREVNCPQDLAFAYYADRDKDLEWWRGTLHTETTSTIRGGVGETSHQIQTFPGLPFKFHIDIKVIEWEAPHRWREICNNGLTHYDVWYVVERIDERRSRVRLLGTAKLKGVFLLLYPIAKPVLRRLTEANFDLLKSKLDALGASARAAPAPAAAAA